MIPCESPAESETRPRGRWTHGAIPVLGLIGGIGAGKSTVARLLADRGAVVIDADTVGHELLEEPSVRDRIVGRFGAGVLAPAGDGGEPGVRRISRRALGAVVFHDAAALCDLEAILHPAMRERFVRAIGRLVREDDGAGNGGRPCVGIVLDAAVLLEAGWDDLCDRVVFVDAPRAERLRRVEQSRGWSEDVLIARERSQWPVAEKRRRADWIINNGGLPDRLGHEVADLLDQLPAGVARRVLPASSLDLCETA